MKPLGLTLSALLLCGSAVAQDPKAPPPKDPPPAAPAPLSDKNQKYLDAYLKAWAERMAGVNGLETKVVLTEIPFAPEPGEPAKRVYTGDASLMKPNSAKMLLKLHEKPTDSRRWRHFIADPSIDDKGRGPFLWEYDYGKKVARVQQLPKEGIGKHPVMDFLFGMKVEALKQRFHLSIDVDDDKKHTENYLHIGITPKLKEDMQEFEKAELVLWKNNKDPKRADLWMLPARLWFKAPNGDQVIWEFQQLATKKEFAKNHFKAPGFPDKDWRSEWSQPPKRTVSRTTEPK
jgi:TIGR03009 family protein